MFQNKDKDLLGIYQYVCDPFSVSLLTDRHLKVRSNTDFVMISRQRRVYVCAWLIASRVARKKLGHDILRHVSNFRRSERDNYFVIGKKPSRKHFEKNNIKVLWNQYSQFHLVSVLVCVALSIRKAFCTCKCSSIRYAKECSLCYRGYSWHAVGHVWRSWHWPWARRCRW